MAPGDIAMTNVNQSLDTTCVWLLSAPEQHIVELNVTAIDHDYERSCSGSSIQV